MKIKLKLTPKSVRERTHKSTMQWRDAEDNIWEVEEMSKTHLTAVIHQLMNASIRKANSLAIKWLNGDLVLLTTEHLPDEEDFWLSLLPPFFFKAVHYGYFIHDIEIIMDDEAPWVFWYQLEEHNPFEGLFPSFKYMAEGFFQDALPSSLILTKRSGEPSRVLAATKKRK